jgi:hypothetical protein
MLRRVVSQKFTDVSDVLTASIIRAKSHCHDDGGSRTSEIFTKQQGAPSQKTVISHLSDLEVRSGGLFSKNRYFVLLINCIFKKQYSRYRA